MVTIANLDQLPPQAATLNSNWNSFGAFGFAGLWQILGTGWEDLDLLA